MDKKIAEQAAVEMTNEFLMNMKKKKKVSIDLIKDHMEKVIIRYLDLLRSGSPGEFSVETDKNVILNIKHGTKIKIFSGNIEYIGYIEETNFLDKNKHLVN